MAAVGRSDGSNGPLHRQVRPRPARPGHRLMPWGPSTPMPVSDEFEWDETRAGALSGGARGACPSHGGSANLVKTSPDVLAVCVRQRHPSDAGLVLKTLPRGGALSKGPATH